MRRLWLWLTLLLFLGLWVATVSDRARAQRAPDRRFGAVEAFWVPEEAARLGIGWERILFYWSEIQPTGPDDWNTLHVDDRWLAEAERQGRDVVGVLKQTPAWATDGLPAAGVPRGLDLPLDDPGNLWANYVRRVAAYYGPRGVHHWVIWNEPDISADVYGHEFSGDVADYYRLLKTAYQVIKAEDPAATVHVAGTTYWHDVLAGREPYLARLLAHAASDPTAAANDYYFDVISLHIYFRVETVPEIVAATDAIRRQYGLTQPIWINETNAAPNQDPQWPVERPAFDVDLEQQAWFLPQAFAAGFAAGAERVAVYKLTDVLEQPGAEPFGLLRADLSPRPAYQAYATLLAQLSHFERVERRDAADHVAITFSRPDATVHLVWASGPLAAEATLPAVGATATMVDVYGASQPVRAVDGAYTVALDPARCAADECLMGGPPRYLVEPIAPDAPAPTVAPVRATAAPELARTGPPPSTTTVSAEPVAVPAAVAVPPADTAGGDASRAAAGPALPTVAPDGGDGPERPLVPGSALWPTWGIGAIISVVTTLIVLWGWWRRTGRAK